MAHFVSAGLALLDRWTASALLNLKPTTMRQKRSPLKKKNNVLCPEKSSLSSALNPGRKAKLPPVTPPLAIRN